MGKKFSHLEKCNHSWSIINCNVALQSEGYTKWHFELRTDYVQWKQVQKYFGLLYYVKWRIVAEFYVCLHGWDFFSLSEHFSLKCRAFIKNINIARWIAWNKISLLQQNTCVNDYRIWSCFHLLVSAMSKGKHF